MFFTEAKQPRFKTPQELLKYMDNIKYDPHKTDDGPNRWRLRTPDQVDEEKLGDCHDQTLYAKTYLAEMGLKPKCLYMIEYTGPKIWEAGSTHSILLF